MWPVISNTCNWQFLGLQVHKIVTLTTVLKWINFQLPKNSVIKGFYFLTQTAQTVNSIHGRWIQNILLSKEMTQPHIKCVDYRGKATKGWSWPVPSERMSEGVPPSPTCLPGQHRDNFTQTGEASKSWPYIRQIKHCPLRLRITAQVICYQIIMLCFRAYNLHTNQASNSIKELLNCN